MFATEHFNNDGCYERNVPRTTALVEECEEPFFPENPLLNPFSSQNITFDDPSYMFYESRFERPPNPLIPPLSFAMNQSAYPPFQYTSHLPQSHYEPLRETERFYRNLSLRSDLGYTPTQRLIPASMSMRPNVLPPIQALETDSSQVSTSKVIPASFKKQKKQKKEIHKNRKKEMDESMYQVDLNKVLTGKDMRMTLMIRNIPNGFALLLVLNLSFTRAKLLSHLDKIVKNKYDFLYLPVDSISLSNLGFAYISMINLKSVETLYKAVGV